MCGPQQKEPPSLRTSPPRSPAPLSARVSFFFCRWQRTFVVEMKFFFKIHVYLSYTHIDRHTHTRIHTHVHTERARERERERERSHSTHSTHTTHTHTHTHTHLRDEAARSQHNTEDYTRDHPDGHGSPLKTRGGESKNRSQNNTEDNPCGYFYGPIRPPLRKKGVEKEKMKSEQHRGLAPWPSSWTH
jgi:hypothetical protein